MSTNMSTNFSLKPFDDLTSVDVYHILRARTQVFVVEQQCAYQDIDGIDFDCMHLVAHRDEALIGYCRIIPPNVIPPSSVNSEDHTQNTLAQNTPNLASTEAPSRIGRVLVLPEHRGHGLARQIVTQAIAYCHDTYKKRAIAISAQTYLIEFYRSLGFESVGEAYLEDGIEHIDMLMQPAKKSKFSTILPTLNRPNYLAILLIIVCIGLIAGVIYLMV